MANIKAETHNLGGGWYATDKVVANGERQLVVHTLDHSQEITLGEKSMGRLRQIFRDADKQEG